MEFDIYVSVWDIDKNGNKTLVQREKANSLVATFNRLSFATFYTGGIGSPVNTSGVTKTVQTLGACNSEAGSALSGIVVGTGLTAVAIDDYKLVTQILHGTTSGTLEHGSHSSLTPSTVGTYCSWAISRPFKNSSGAEITVNEAGLYCLSGGFYFMLDRTLVTPFAIANGVTRTVQYEYKTTV